MSIQNDNSTNRKLPVRILVISDTHIPRTTEDLPHRIYEAARRADMILHAGDFVDKRVLDALKAIKQTWAVSGNMDPESLRHILNTKEIIEVGRFKIGLTHGHGAPKDLIDNVRGEFSGVDVIVFGHAHHPINIVKDGVLFFNPGSPTDKVFTSVNSYGILEVTEKKVEGKIVRI